MLFSIILVICSLTSSSARISCSDVTVCDINCGSHSSVQCTDSVIDASSATIATIFCPDLSSCRNTTVICPIGKGSSCEITCNDSLSCDHSTIHSKSMSTSIHCISSDTDKTNICSTVSIVLPDADKRNSSVALNCLAIASNPEQEVVTVCDGITVTTDIYRTIAPNALTNASVSSSLSFICKGNGVRCDSLDAHLLGIDHVSVILNGNGSHLNDALVVIDNHLDIKMNDSASISLSGFYGVTMKHGSSVVIQMSNGSQLVSNTLWFNFPSSFQLINPDVNTLESKLLDANKIVISNKGRYQTVLIENINGDMNNTLTATNATTFTIKCRNNQSMCGNIGAIDLAYVQDVAILVDKGVEFGSIIKAQHVTGLNVNVLEGGKLNGTALNATYVIDLNISIYGETRGQNVIAAAYALGFNLYCNHPKSCSEDLQIHTSPSRTNIHCIGTGCDMMTLFVDQFPDELTFEMTDCPCEEERYNLCISEWNINCKGSNTTSTLKDGICTGICCGSIVDRLQETFPDKYECPLSNETAYLCQENKDCVLFCDNPSQYERASAFKCSSNGVVDASMASSLSIFCNGGNGTCAGLHILAPAQNQYVNPKKYAQISCSKNGCSDLNIDVMQTPNLYLDCLSNAICTNITLTNIDQAIQNALTPNINIDCSVDSELSETGICDGIRIIAGGANVSYVCKNAVCNNTSIQNDGITTLDVSGTLAKFTSAEIVNYKSVLITNQKLYIYIRNGTLDNVTVSINGGSAWLTNDNGAINNVSINANNADDFAFYCNGGCRETLDANLFQLDSTKRVEIHVANDRITGDHYRFRVKNASNVTFAAHAKGVFDDIVINERNAHIELRCDKDGEFNLFNISSTKVDSVFVENNMGAINELIIETNGAMDKVEVNIVGTLSNSTIDAALTRNLSVMCTNSKAVDDSCNNVTMTIPVSKDAVSSLLCREEGCQSLTFYTVNDMDDMKVTLEECPCESAIHDSCLSGENEWIIYCEAHQNGASVFKENRCEGGCCGDIVNDVRVKGCDYGGGGSKKHRHIGAVIASVCGAILALVVIVAAVYYFYSKKKKSMQQEALLTVND